MATATSIVTVNSFVDEITLSSTDTDICFDGENGVTDATIATDGSETGVLYTLHKKSDDSQVGDAIEGTGSALSFPVGAVSENSTFYVKGEVPKEGSAMSFPNSKRSRSDGCSRRI